MGADCETEVNITIKGDSAESRYDAGADYHIRAPGIFTELVMPKTALKVCIEGLVSPEYFGASSIKMGIF